MLDTLVTRRPPPRASSPAHAPAPALEIASPPSRRRAYRMALAWAFTTFNMLRLVSYLPTVWAIHAQGNSSQHSLWTWLSWTGANATMAVWMYEQNDARMNTPIVLNAANAVLCAGTVVVISWYRA